MKNALYFFLFTVLFATTSFAQSASLSGKVIDGESKEPILFGTMSLYQNGNFKVGTQTDFDGNYNFANLEPGIYMLEASNHDYITVIVENIPVAPSKVVTVNVEIPKTKEPEELKKIIAKENTASVIQKPGWSDGVLTVEQMRALPKRNLADSLFKSGSIGGKAIDAESLEPLMFADVNLFQNDTLKAKTSTGFEGFYQFLKINPGTYQMVLSYFGYQTLEVVNIPVIVKESTVLNMKLSKEGVLIDTTTKIVTIPLYNPWSFVDNLGTYCYVMKDSLDAKIDLKRVDDFRLDRGLMTYHSYRNHQYGSVGGFGGKIMEQGSKDVVKYADVKLYRDYILLATTRSDISGNYYFLNLEPDKYSIELTLPDGQMEKVSAIEVTRGLFKGVDLLIQQN